MCDQAKSPIHLSGVRYKNPVGKRLELSEDGGSLVKTLLLEERSQPGELINLTFQSAQDAFQYRLKSSPRHMFFTGTFSPDRLVGAVLSKSAQENAHRHFEPETEPVIVTATKQYLEFRDVPGLISIDVDYKNGDEVAAIWPEKPEQLKTAEAVLEVLYELLPEAKGCPVMIVPSSSSMIEHSDTGKLLSGPGGWRVLLPTIDASQTPRILQVIHHRSWARQKCNFAYVSASGGILIRSFVDLALGRPTQPDFPCADLGNNLGRVSKANLLENLDGKYLDPNLVQLSSDVQSLATQHVEQAREALKPASQSTRSNCVQRCIADAMNKGVTTFVATRLATRKFEAGVILGSDYIRFEGGYEARAADLIGPKGADYDCKRCLDPIDPEYGGSRLVGKFYWNKGLRPGIHSFAHGSKFYCLRYDNETAIQAVEGLKDDTTAAAHAIALADVNEVDQAKLIKQAAIMLGLGNLKEPVKKLVQVQRHLIAQQKSMEDEWDDFNLDKETRPPDLSVALPTEAFPQIRPGPNGIRILDHQDNIKHLLETYGIDYRYNMITKEFEWSHPQILQTGDNASIALHSNLVGLCSLNNVPKDHLDLHLTGLGNSNTYNPVTDHLSSLSWDGKPRLEKLAEKMRPSDVNVARVSIRIFLLQACAAADHATRARRIHPEYLPHFESVLVFVGGQGIGKTKGTRKLLPPALRQQFKESVQLDLKNKDQVKIAISAWVSELGELDSIFRKSDISSVKAFMSQSRDELRMPYAQKSSDFERRTVFVGTVNEEHFLADETGNRRFLPLTVERVDVGWSDEEIEQLWAEAWSRYSGGEQWWATAPEEVLLARNAETYRAKTGLEDQIEATFAWGYPPDWKQGRRTVTQALDLMNQHHLPTLSRVDSKSAGHAFRRLWEGSGLTESVGGVPHLQNESGELVRINAVGGSNRGWILPPTKVSLMPSVVQSSLRAKRIPPKDQ